MENDNTVSREEFDNLKEAVKYLLELEDHRRNVRKKMLDTLKENEASRTHSNMLEPNKEGVFSHAEDVH